MLYLYNCLCVFVCVCVSVCLCLCVYNQLAVQETKEFYNRMAFQTWKEQEEENAFCHFV